MVAPLICPILQVKTSTDSLKYLAGYQMLCYYGFVSTCLAGAEKAREPILF